MKCSNIKLQLALYVGGDLLKRDIPALLAHLEHCPECAIELDLLKQSQSALGKIIQADTPDPLPQDFSLNIHQKIVKQETKQSRHTWKNLEWLWKKPALVSYAFILAFCLGVGLSWQYWQRVYRNAMVEYMVVQPIFEQLESELGKKFNYQIIEGSSFTDTEELPLEPSLYIIMHKSSSNDNKGTFSIDYYGISYDLRSYRRYPWIYHRKKDLIKKAGVVDNIYIIICPLPGSSLHDLKNIRDIFNSQIKSSFKKGV